MFPLFPFLSLTEAGIGFHLVNLCVSTLEASDKFITAFFFFFFLQQAGKGFSFC